MKKYDLTENQIKQIANLAVQENGEECVAAEVSLMANLFELQSSFKNLYNYIRNSGWFSMAAYWMDNGSSSKKAVETTRNVLVNGERVLPAYINEHDCFTDILWIQNNGTKHTDRDYIKNRSNYVAEKTVIRNRYDSTYTFYEFPSKYSDPFGYTAEAFKKVGGMTALDKAKTLLRMPLNAPMTGYTPTGRSYFVNAGKYYTVPKVGDVVYFYSSTKGRIGHTGIVTAVNAADKVITTIEGNSDNKVSAHTYNYSKLGGKNRVNGFGRPDFTGAGVTAKQFVDKALSYYGYHEKASNMNLESFTGNSGSANYQKFQPEVGAGNGDEWCQYFVDGIAFECCSGKPTPQPTPTNRKNVEKGQAWLNKYYGTLLETTFGKKLTVDGEYGSKTRATCLAVWKDIMNRKHNAHLTPGNSNFGGECMKYADKATVKVGVKNTFCYIVKLILSARGYYKGAMNSNCTQTVINAVKKYQKENGLTADGICGKETWYSLFN